MSPNAIILDAAGALFAEYQGGQPFTALPGPWNIGTISEAYAVQSEYLKLLAEAQGQVAGYKLAYTTAAMQQQAGWTEPLRRGAAGHHHLSVASNFEGGRLPAAGL